MNHVFLQLIFVIELMHSWWNIWTYCWKCGWKFVKVLL